MPKEVWGTFSVNDHLDERSFVTEVLLYDCLVVPVPPNGDERQRWRDEKWDPDRLERLCVILGDRARRVAWDVGRQQSWQSRYDAGKDVASTPDWAFYSTRLELTEGLPPDVTGMTAVTNYTSIESLEAELGIHSSDSLPAGVSTAVIGHEFFVPNDERWTHEELLKEAVSLSSEPEFRRKRRAFWQWHQQFLRANVTDQGDVRRAVVEMQDLIEEEKAVARRAKLKMGTNFVFLVASVGVGLVGGPITAAAVGGAFLSVGGFVADRLLEDRRPDRDSAVALLRDTRRHFGWDAHLGGQPVAAL